MTTIKEQADVNYDHRPTTLNIPASLSAGVRSKSSLISVADHVEHLTDTVIGRSLSFYRLLFYRFF